MIKEQAKLLDRELTNEEERYLKNMMEDAILSIQRPISPELIGKRVVVRSGYSSNIVGYVTNVKRTTFGFVSGDFSCDMPNHRFVSSYDDKPSYTRI